MKYIDLHTHSTASDGTVSPAELVELARKAGLAAVALTDHDTIAGLKEAREAAADMNMELIRGCELSTATPLGNMHIVALWLPQNCDPLQRFLDHLKNNRSLRNQQIIEKLKSFGINMDMAELKERAGGSVGRPHFAEILVERGIARDRDDAFSTWLGVHGKAYAAKPAPTPEQAFRIIRELGASGILAHPLLKPLPPQKLDDLVKHMKACGLFGLEAWHSALSPQDTRQIINLGKKYDLALSGGSDFHGANKPDINLGVGKGNLAIGIDVLEKMKERRKKLGLPVN